MVPERIQTGIVATTYTPHDEDYLERVVALLRIFSKEACEIAGRCAEEQTRDEIDGKMMKHSLMYVARTFFQKDDTHLKELVDSEMRDMRAEEEEGADEEGEEEDGEEEQEEEEEEGEEEEGEVSEESAARSGARSDPTTMTYRVNKIVESWTRWKPEDPIEQMLKRAIDHSPPVSSEA
tara:strand:+ start:1402 stop:1938 length:537 start_codon:yes stop_codon:yes gene_type:complete